MEVSQRTSIIVNPETRKKLQLRKQENNLKNVDEVILQALKLSGSQAVGVVRKENLNKEGVRKK